MAFSSDIQLPSNAKYYGYIASNFKLNSNYDITWSYKFQLSNVQPTDQYGFSTFLTSASSIDSAQPGQYLGALNPNTLSAYYLLNESGIVILTESGTEIITQMLSLSGMLLHIAFDSTGLFAVSSTAGRTGVPFNQVYRNALVIRDFQNNVIVNTPLTALSTSFSLTSDDFQTLRFRYANLGRKLYIDYRPESTTTYSNLTTVQLNYGIANYSNIDNIFSGFSFCSPISTTSTSLTSTLLMKDFHIEGLNTPITTTTLSSRPLSASFFNTYTGLAGVTARPA